MLLLGRKTAREKIASFLMMLVRRTTASPHAVNGEVKIVLPLTREAMADYLGLTIETVSRQFSFLRKEGLIVLDGKRNLAIPDSNALQAESGSETA
jgi:CRP/FNR family transcriptional regulator